MSRRVASGSSAVIAVTTVKALIGKSRVSGSVSHLARRQALSLPIAKLKPTGMSAGGQLTGGLRLRGSRRTAPACPDRRGRPAR
jgi:hypothetical protein